jgi:hypothetical protein
MGGILMVWGKKKHQKNNETELKEVTEDSSHAVDIERFTDWVDTSISDFEKKGGFKDLPGHGKPISDKYLKGDVFTGILKESNYLPPWVDLQHEIRDSIANLILDIENQENILVDEVIKDINKKIRKYNQSCPSPLMQKGLLSAERIQQQYEKWQ